MTDIHWSALARADRELVVLANYVVVYQEDAIAPRVLRVLHAAQQWPSTPE